MINRNHDYLQETKKTTENFASRYLGPILYLIFFLTSPLFVIVGTFVLTPIFYLGLYRNIRITKKFFLVSFGVYLFLSVILSLSPRLQFESFKFFHPNWQEVDGKITSFKTDWTPTTKNSASSATAMISYAYTVDGKRYEYYTRDAVAHYSNQIWNTESNKENYKNLLEKALQNHIKNREYKILIKNKTMSKLFIPLDYFSSPYSFYFQFLIIILKFLGVLAIIIFSPAFFTFLKEFLRR
ncbi:hypothetical protein OMO38_00325 [Chryseobacterium sp. 09-1422]|uniref:Uncharacterized protein n=1 Tax=Chryseobacterium kimseyorum TaxID=2984028 RepID=A0ABT3HT60_9FLAO|nr:hypothetical protein [Chryseobacterium kimseyorum]MCW3166959.1 hypothetical protein [Chryseobacterium kimseyorum]